ncbi:MAG TPA: glycosyltransferase family 4 protein [Gemmatimonadales bacterium]|nr:glycosyltransferase family 4 protein [Gemmatimonadales bacterium]
MRIVYVTQRLPYGHGETFIVPEIEALIDAGHEVLVIPRRSSDPIIHDDVDALVARMRRLPAAPVVAAAAAGTVARQPRRAALALWECRRTRPRRRGISNAVATAEGMWLARIARAWRADHLHAHWAHLTATMAMGASEVSGIPWSFTAHRYDVLLNNLLDRKLRSARFGRFIARYMLDIAARLVSPEAAARAIVVHMGVRLPTAPAPRVERATPVVVCPGRLVPMKGQLYLVDAAAILAARGVPFEMWLAGDGPDRAAITARMQAHGLERRIRLLGTLPHAELQRLYRDGAVDCAVLPSVDLGEGVHEGLSVALIEAMAHGIPAVSTPTGGQAELLDGGAGLLVPERDAGALADALAGLLASSDLRGRVGVAGRRRIEQEFDADAIAAELVRRFSGERRAATAAIGVH